MKIATWLFLNDGVSLQSVQKASEGFQLLVKSSLQAGWLLSVFLTCCRLPASTKGSSPGPVTQNTGCRRYQSTAWVARSLVLFGGLSGFFPHRALHQPPWTCRNWGAGSGWSDRLPLSLLKKGSELVLYHLYFYSTRLDGFSRWQHHLLASCY